MVEQVRRVISERTPLSIGLILTIAALLAGAVAWTHSVEARVAHAEYIGDDLAKHRVTDAEYMQKQNEFIHSVDLRLSRIEAKLDKIGGK